MIESNNLRVVLVMAAVLLTAGCSPRARSGVVGIWSTTVTANVDGRLADAHATAEFTKDGQVELRETSSDGRALRDTRGSWELKPDGTTIVVRMDGYGLGSSARLAGDVLRTQIATQTIIWNRQ